MCYFETRYQAVKAFPNAIIRKIVTGNKKGMYTVFNDYTTYTRYKLGGLVK